MSEKKDTVLRSEGTRRYDRPGHLDPAHAARLFALSRGGRGQEDESELLRALAEEDDLASELGETTLVSMTSGAEALTDELEARVDEEVGGPFVVTEAVEEFDDLDDVDEVIEERNPLDVPRQPKPTRTSWGSIYLPRIQKIAAWFGKHWFETTTPLPRGIRRKLG